MLLIAAYPGVTVGLDLRILPQSVWVCVSVCAQARMWSSCGKVSSYPLRFIM